MSKKKICLSAINAQYVHTNLAVRLLKNLDTDNRTVVTEHTINGNIDDILDDIMLHNPASVMFSVYIWNINYVMKLTDSIKKISPDTVMVLSGPEVSKSGKSLLKDNKAVDIVSFAKGEINFVSLINAVDTGDYDNVEGIYYRKDDNIICNEIVCTYSLDEQVFPYYDIDDVKDKILYFETSRGCPFNCSYCMSGNSEKIDYMNTQKVCDMLDIFVKNDVKQVKFVDRTFNYPILRAIEIIRIIIELNAKYKNSRTTFHCEINPSMVNDEFIEAISALPKGLVQFEIGVQSTNSQTLDAIHRKGSVDKQIENIKRMVALGNIKCYVDLIAGLPYETYDIIANSFNTVYSTDCSVIHLGFLKVLKGAQMEKDAAGFGIVYRDYPPYEILRSDSISYDELSKLKNIEQLIDTYKNSGNFNNIIPYAIGLFNSPFEFYEKYCDYNRSIDYFGRPHKFSYYFDTLYDFLCTINGDNKGYMRELLLHDFALNSKPRNYPACLGDVLNDDKRETTRNIYNNPELVARYLPEYVNMTPSTISRQCNIEIYEYDLDSRERLDERRVVLYKYGGEKSSTIIDCY